MTEKKKFGENLADAVSSIQGQLAQLSAELDEIGLTAQVDRVRSISNALKEITP